MRVAPFAVFWAFLSGILSAAVCSVAVRAEAQESQLDSLRKATQASATDPAASLAYGRALRRAGRYTEAANELRRGYGFATANPRVLADLHWEVARVQMDRHDFFQARAECGAFAKIRGASADGHACTADAHLVWQRATEALAETALALADDPTSYEAKVAEGRAHELELDSEKSQAAFRTAVGWRPDGVDAHLGLGRVLLRNGARADGIAELRRAIELDPHGPDALYELARALPPGGESRSLLEAATRERPSFAEAWLALGAQELDAGMIAQAKRAAEAAAHNDGKSVAPHVLFGKVALADGRTDDAIKEGEVALKILANSAPAKLLIADANAKKGEIDRALEAYQAAWGLDRSDPTPLVHASEACHVAGRDTSARAFGVKATQEFPNWGPGWEALGDALVGQSEQKAARDAYSKALSTNGPIDRGEVQKKLSTLR